MSCWFLITIFSGDPLFFFFFFFNDTATTEIYTLSLHDALPISPPLVRELRSQPPQGARAHGARARARSEEHTSELQSPCNLVCRLLLEKKKNSERSPSIFDRAMTCVSPLPMDLTRMTSSLEYAS